MFMSVCVRTTGLASPSALQSPVASKPKNGSLAISKPQEGQLYFARFPSSVHHALVSSGDPFCHAAAMWSVVFIYLTF